MAESEDPNQNKSLSRAVSSRSGSCDGNMTRKVPGQSPSPSASPSIVRSRCCEQIEQTDNELNERPPSPCLEGFSYEFLPKLDLKYECPICMQALRSPYQTRCGHRFCENCIKQWLKNHLTCPIDKETLKSEDVFPDNFAKREILSLKVKCPYGCSVVTELRTLEEVHLDECQYKRIECPNRGCGLQIPLCHKEKHLREECIKRAYKCSLCNENMSFDEKVEHQMKKCPMVKDVCLYCKRNMLRRDMTVHLRQDCPNAVVLCPFSQFGCKIEVRRQDMGKHLDESSRSHTINLLEACKGFHDILSHLPHSRHDLGISLHRIQQGASALYQKDDYLGDFSLQCAQKGWRSSEELQSAAKEPVRKSSVASISAGATCENVCGDVNRGQQRPTESVAMLKEKIETMSAREAEQRQMIIELDCKNQHLAKIVQEHEQRLADIEGKGCNGVYIWRIGNCSKLLQVETPDVRHSPGFYTSFHGYKVCLRVNLNRSDNSQQWSHLSLFVHFMKGDSDDLLEWPFKGTISLSLIDQTENTTSKKDIVEKFDALPNLAAFQRPKTPRNFRGFGYTEFAPLSTVTDGTYIKDNTLIVKAVIKDLIRHT